MSLHQFVYQEDQNTGCWNNFKYAIESRGKLVPILADANINDVFIFKVNIIADEKH